MQRTAHPFDGLLRQQPSTCLKRRMPKIGTFMEAVYLALCKAGRPVTAREIACITKKPADQVRVCIGALLTDGFIENHSTLKTRRETKGKCGIYGVRANVDCDLRITNTAKRLQTALLAHGPMTVAECARRSGIRPRTVHSLLNRFKGELFERIGTSEETTTKRVPECAYQVKKVSES